MPTDGLLEIGSRKRLYHAGTLGEASAENAVGVLEHAVLQTDNDELGALEASLDQATDVLRVRQVQRGVDFVQDVHGGGLELQQGHDEG